VRIFVLAAGRIREKALRAVADDYLARVRHYARCDEIEVKVSKDLERVLPKEATLVLLEPDGEALTSRALSAKLERWGARGKGDIAFVIGGAEGIPEAIGAKAHARLSLSTLTFPHRLARVMLLEQLYRSFTILRGEPYARED
jgi:23S rRNA (pseudouridine1915-N3)-methyltransferase